MRLIKGDYEVSKAKIKEVIYEGYKLDEIFSNVQFLDLKANEIVTLYSELKQQFEATMIISIDLTNNDAKNLYTNSVVSMNKYIDSLLINKMVNKFKSNVEDELFSNGNKSIKNLSYLNRVMEAANIKADKDAQK